MYFEQKIYKLLNEEDVLDKMIQYKDKDGNEKEATVGGILKKGADHPAHDLAQAEYDKEHGEGGEEEPKKPAPKIDVNPFDDKEKKAPTGAPDSGGSQQSQAASETSNKVLDILAQNNHRIYVGGAEGEHVGEMKDALNAYKDNGGTAEDLAKAIENREAVDTSDMGDKDQGIYDMQDDINDLKALNILSNDVFGEKLPVNPIEYGKKRGLDVLNYKEKYGPPNAMPKKSGNRYELSDDLYSLAKDQGLVSDEPAPASADEPDEPVSKDAAISNSLETIADAGERGADFSDPGVKDQIMSDFNNIKDAGGSVQDIANAVKDQAEYMDQDNFELLDAAAQEVFGEPVPHGVSDDEMGSQYLDKSQNESFKSRKLDMLFERKIYKLLNEEDEFKAKSKATGKVVVFKSKDAMDAAVKGGSHEPLDKPTGGSAGKPQGQSVFAKPSGDDEKSSEPIAPGNYSEKNNLDQSLEKYGSHFPEGTNADTKLEDLDEDDVESFYDDMAYEVAKEYDITAYIFTDDSYYHTEYVAEKGGTIKDMYDSVISSAEEYAADEGTLPFGENKKSEKQPFREHYNRLFKGRDVL